MGWSTSDRITVRGHDLPGEILGHMDIGAFSFCQDKIITTGGEGGMVTTDDTELWSRMWSYKDHGKSWAAVYEREHPPGYRWLHEGFGTNWRMTEMQSALGRALLGKLPSDEPAETFQLQELTLPVQTGENIHAWYGDIVFRRVAPPRTVFASD